MIRKYLILLSSLIILAEGISFSAGSISENRFSVSQLKDLPQNDVNCIYRDSRGFLWIGTLDGLHRYDGYSYKTYRLSDDPNSISSNMIIDMDEDSKGNLWVATYGKGICKFNPVTEEFTRYNVSREKAKQLPSDDVTYLIIDNQDVLWFGNWFGFSRVMFDNNMENIRDLITFPMQEYLGVDSEVKNIHQDKYGEIWVGTNAHIIRVEDPYKKKSQVTMQAFECHATSLFDYEDGLLIGGEQLLAIQRESNGEYQLRHLYDIFVNKLIYLNQQIWVGNREGITCLGYSPENDWQVMHQINKENYGNIVQSNIVTSVYMDNQNQILVGNRGGGVYSINLNPRKFHHFQNTDIPGSIGSNFIQCVFEDHKRNLWIGTEDKGVGFLSTKKSFDYRSGFQSLVANSDSSENRAYCIEEVMTPNSEEHESMIWIGTSYAQEILAINPENLQSLEVSKPTPGFGFVFALENQGDSVLWAGTYGNGLWRLSLNEEGAIKSFVQLTPDYPRESKLTSYIIRDILLDSKNNLWISTDKGLNRIRPSEIGKRIPEFEAYTKGEGEHKLSHDYLMQIHEGLDGRVWLGSMGAGLFSYSEEGQSGDYHFSNITEEDGLASNAVKSILEDNKGHIWLATNKGLTRYNPYNGDIANYDMEDGLQHNEFSEICAFRRSNGQLVFGGINGFNVFYPDQISRDTVTPRIFLTDFYIQNEAVRPGQQVDGKVILDKSIEYTKELELSYKNNSFSIGFVGLSNTAPQKNRYKYKLEGFDNDWYTANASYRIAKYTNIPPGEYTFKVLASNSENIWTKNPVLIKIIVKPPFYQSTLAYILYVLFAILILFIAYRLTRIVTTRKKEIYKASLEKRKVEEIAQMKLRFFTNISHEFRTPLTLITTPLEKLINHNNDMKAEERLGNYSLIKQNANMMLRLINQLMDFRRLDQDKMKLRVEVVELVDFVNKIYNSFKPLADQKKISFNFESGGGNKIMIWIDPEKMEKVIYNLLSNSFKFTPKNGSISIEIEHSDLDNTLTLYVSDTGVGIDVKELGHIFERYYQPDRKNQQSYGGTGIGLALAKGLVELHKGSIDVKSQKEKGTTFSVTLNKGKAWMDEKVELKEAEHDLPTETLPDRNVPVSEIVKDTALPKGKYKLLIVEDNLDLREVIADLFREDYIIYQADDGVKGYKRCLEQQPDLVISDIMMPNMDGIEFCHKIKNEEEVSHIPVLLLTAKDTEESMIEGFESGADAYMPKPFNPDLLRARVIALLKNREKMRMRFQKEIEINPMIIANSPADSKFMDQILALIEENLSDSEFSVEKLADLYGVSRIYLNRKLKALTGETSSQFLRNIRLKHAAELLVQNVLTVSEITWEVGYNDLRTFRTRFKEKFGVSPSEYAKTVPNGGGHPGEEKDQQSNIDNQQP